MGFNAIRNETDLQFVLSAIKRDYGNIAIQDYIIPCASPTETFKFPAERESFTLMSLKKNLLFLPIEHRALIKLCGNIRCREIHEFSLTRDSAQILSFAKHFQSRSLIDRNARV